MCAGALQSAVLSIRAQNDAAAGAGAKPAASSSGPAVSAPASGGGSMDNTVVGRAVRRRGAGSLLAASPALTSTASARPGGLG